MKNSKILFCSVFMILLTIANRSDAQKKIESVVDKYFTFFANEKNYRNTSVTEDMIKNIRKQGVWGNPKFDLFMSQIKLSQHASFDISDDNRLKEIGSQLISKIDNDHMYKLYTLSQKDGSATYFYTLTNEHKVIIEVAIISIVQETHRIGGASFIGDNINLGAIKSFLGEGK